MVLVVVLHLHVRFVVVVDRLVVVVVGLVVVVVATGSMGLSTDPPLTPVRHG